MYNEFKNDEEMWELGKQRELAKIREASFKTEYENKGIEKGIEKGTLKTLISSCNLIIQNLYKVECKSWLNSLSKNQLEKLQELAFKEKDFKSLKEKIESL